jgi:hypothetical protein
MQSYGQLLSQFKFTPNIVLVQIALISGQAGGNTLESPEPQREQPTRYHGLPTPGGNHTFSLPSYGLIYIC